MAYLLIGGLAMVGLFIVVAARVSKARGARPLVQGPMDQRTLRLLHCAVDSPAGLGSMLDPSGTTGFDIDTLVRCLGHPREDICHLAAMILAGGEMRFNPWAGAQEDPLLACLTSPHTSRRQKTYAALGTATQFVASGDPELVDLHGHLYRQYVQRATIERGFDSVFEDPLLATLEMVGAEMVAVVAVDELSREDASDHEHSLDNLATALSKTLEYYDRHLVAASEPCALSDELRRHLLDMGLYCGEWRRQIIASLRHHIARDAGPSTARMRRLLSELIALDLREQPPEVSPPQVHATARISGRRDVARPLRS